MPINPVMILAVGIIGGTAAAATYAIHYVEEVNPQLTIADFRPAFPWEGLPLPVFFYTKPEVLAQMRRSK